MTSYTGMEDLENTTTEILMHLNTIFEVSDFGNQSLPSGN